jgi:murein DD-endopeptidase MepM/ murein hydrolase activator NlpD
LVNGGKPVSLTTPTKPISTKKTDNLFAVHPIDSAFRKEFEASSGSNADIGSIKMEIKNINFMPPIRKGVLLKKYDYPKKHFGVDLVAKKSEPILAVAEGTVILASWTQDSGYVIAVQHPYNLISFYKHNATLSKKVGEAVKTGEQVAIIGNSGELTDGPHLHFELWRAGIPLNPEDFIKF